MPKYGASREISQSFNDASEPSSAPNHSWVLPTTSDCKRGRPMRSLPVVHSCKNSTQRGSESLKKKCSEHIKTGRAWLRVEYGSIRSVGAYTALHASQESPY